MKFLFRRGERGNNVLREEIIAGWNNSLRGNYLHRIASVHNYPAYTMINNHSYGVAIPLDKRIEVNEDFSDAKICSVELIDSETHRTGFYLTLTTGIGTDKGIFSALCEQFVYPGEHGEFRRELISSPLKWWIEMKKIFGNRNVDELVYDTLGELCVYSYLVRKGVNAIWNGPLGSSFDIESNEFVAEVKSSVSRSEKTITVHGKTQLSHPKDKDLYLYYCVFEPSSNTGYSINDIIYNLEKDGYDISSIDSLLLQKGFEHGKSSRQRKFILWNIYKYVVDDEFPRITDSSFVDGKEPDGVTSISYVVNLEGIPCEVIEIGDKINEV